MVTNTKKDNIKIVISQNFPLSFLQFSHALVPIPNAFSNKPLSTCTYLQQKIKHFYYILF